MMYNVDSFFMAGALRQLEVPVILENSRLLLSFRGIKTL